MCKAVLSTQYSSYAGSEFDNAAWAAWFASYRPFVYRYAEFAEANGADLFVVGNELRHAVPQEAQWRQTIAGVRERFSGPVTYSSLCYGEELENQWWDALDYIGINFYRTLTNKDDVTLAELKDAWVPHLEEYADLADQWGMQILFTEIGFCSRDGGNHDCERIQNPQLDIQEQTDLYQAAFESLDGQSWFLGMFWHQWASDPFHGGTCDDFYYYHDKPAEDIVRAWYGGEPRPLEPEPDYNRTAPIYTDAVASGWEATASDAAYTLTATDHVYTGTHAISVTAQPWGFISFQYPSFDTGPYAFLEFYLRSAAPREQQLWVVFEQDGPDLPARPLDAWGRYVEGCVIEPGVWKRIRIPLWHLEADDRSIVALKIFEGTGEAPASFWLDEIRLVSGVQYAGCLPRYGEPQFILRVNDWSPQGYEPFLTSGDFNGDGLEDVVITKMTFQTTETYELDILLNDGNGGMTLATSGIFSGTVPAVQNPKKVIVADFNGDGRSDIFVADHGYDVDPHPGYQNTLVLSTPDGKLMNASGNLPQQSDFSHSASAADIENDGDLDLYVGNTWGQNMIPPQIWLNAGDGSFTIAQDRLPITQTNLSLNGYTASEFVDVNKDSFVDLILGDAGDDLAGGPGSVVLLNDGTGHFSLLPGGIPSKPFSASDIALDILPADLNSDTYQDLLMAYTRGNYVGRYIQVLINNGNGSFRDETDTRLPQSDNNDAYIYRLEWMDMDHDGDADLVARTWSDADPNPLLFLNDGTGHFNQVLPSFGLGSLYYTFADLEGDGGHDLVYATYAPPEDIYVIRELGCPVFLPLILRNWSAGN